MARAQWTQSKPALVVMGLALATFALAGCSSKEYPAPPSADAVVAAFSGSQPGDSGGGPAGSAGAARRNSGGSVTIDVTWENPQQTDGALTFSVAMDTHSVELDGYDLAKLAVLRNDRGQEVKPRRWDAPPGGHHRSGVLIFPSSDGSGKPIVGSGTKAVELVIRGVAGVEERVLRWEIAS